MENYKKQEVRSIENGLVTSYEDKTVRKLNEMKNFAEIHVAVVMHRLIRWFACALWQKRKETYKSLLLSEELSTPEDALEFARFHLCF